MRENLTKRFRVVFVLSLPVFMLAMAHMIPASAMQPWMHGTASRWLQSALTAPMVWWAGWSFFRRGWNSVIIGVPS